MCCGMSVFYVCDDVTVLSFEVVSICSDIQPKDVPENLKNESTFLHGIQYLFDILVDKYVRSTWLKWGTLNF